MVVDDRSNLFARIMNEPVLVTPSIEAEALEEDCFVPGIQWAQPESDHVPLSPMQLRYFENKAPTPPDYVACLSFERELTTDQVEELFGIIWKRHDALRSGFCLTRRGWVRDRERAQEPLLMIDCSNLNREQQIQQMETVCQNMANNLGLTRGAQVKMAWFYGGSTAENRLLFMVHPYVIDQKSWEILLGEINDMATASGKGRPVYLEPIQTENSAWCKKLNAYAQSEAIFSELNYWCGESRCGVSELPVDFPRHRQFNTLSSRQTITNQLNSQLTTNLFDRLASVDGINVQDTLLAAMSLAFTRWMRNGTLLVDILQNGRGFQFNGMNLKRTVGCLESRFPLRLNLIQGQTLATHLWTVANKLQKIPRRGSGYDLLRNMIRNYGVRARLHLLPEAEVSFQYRDQPSGVGNDQALIQIRPEGQQPVSNHKPMRHYLLEQVTTFDGTHLNLSWHFSRCIHQESTINKLAQDCLNALITIINEDLFQPEQR